MRPGEAERDEALARVALGAAEWIQEALVAIHSVARQRATFTSDHVWSALPPPPEGLEPRAMGAALRRAVSMGWIARTDRTVETSRPSGHRRPVRVWASKIVPPAVLFGVGP